MTENEQRREEEEATERDETKDLDLPDEKSADVKGGIKAIERDPSIAGQFSEPKKP